MYSLKNVSSVYFSFNNFLVLRYHKIGIMVIFVHDITDIFLEFAKCNYYLKNRNGKFYALNDGLSTVAFALFAGSWFAPIICYCFIRHFHCHVFSRFLFRLYWFPLRILYAAGIVAFDRLNSVHGGSLLTFFNILLWILLLLNVYWFYVRQLFVSNINFQKY
jgi:ceramide synthetase